MEGPMLRDRIRQGASKVRRGLKRRVKEALGREPRPTPHWASTPAGPPSPLASEARAEPVAEAVVEPVEAASEPAGDDVVGPPLTVEQVQELFEDMVRPALQSDGGDIDLVKVEDNDVYVRLTGACKTCPSSTVTMKMGIERLLVEEFPQFRYLIQVA